VCGNSTPPRPVGDSRDGRHHYSTKSNDKIEIIHIFRHASPRYLRCITPATEATMNLLHIDSSILGANSVSRTLSAEIVAAERARQPGLSVTRRDLGAAPFGHLSAVHLAAFQGAAPDSAELQADITAGQDAMSEFLAADILVIGAPMYNFGVPSQLKAWIDRIAVAGKTFRYTASGAQGLAGGKRVVIASSRGGFYGPGSAAAALDHQESYLRGVFGFLGITDVSFIRAEGVAVSPEARANAMAGARAEILAAA
jgi:FMN-dependent NADH-azoreductase